MSLLHVNYKTVDPLSKSLKKAATEQEIKEIPVHNVTVIVYEGCEYLIYKEDKNANSSYGFMAHKGNCSNRIHKCK